MTKEITEGFPEEILNPTPSWGPELPEDRSKKLCFVVLETSTGSYDTLKFFEDYCEELEYLSDNGLLTGDIRWDPKSSCWVVEVDQWWCGEGVLKLHESEFGRNATIRAFHAAYKVLMEIEAEERAKLPKV